MWFRRVPGWQQEVKGWERGRDAPCSHGPRVEAGIAGGLGEWELGVAVTSILLAALQPLPTTTVRVICVAAFFETGPDNEFKPFH